MEMKNLINVDFIEAKERLKNLGCRPVQQIKQYERPFKELNQKKSLVKAVIIIEKGKKRFN